MNQYDFIVVGCGLSGLYTAYSLARKGRVALIAEVSLEDSNSYFAQGGMAAVVDPDDRVSDHFDDTMEAGRGLCNSEAVDILTREAPLRIDELIREGMRFDLDERGKPALGLEGGHHHKRILHAGGDATGRMVTSFMIQQVRQTPQITILAYHHLASLVVDGGRCVGLWSYNKTAGKMELFFASAVILATGGAAALYSPTTNPPTALGDGIALAHEVGATLCDLEFVQFHPTSLCLPNHSAFLISEAVRGEGAHLLDTQGRRFMTDKHPLGELAPRDVVARAIYDKMQEEGCRHVTLSLAHLDSTLLRRRFPTISEYCKHAGVDFSTAIPVTPAAHYTVGGIRVDLHGHTDVCALYAVGETASTGVMGANRLASNSLVECLVFGKRIADHVSALPEPLSDERCHQLQTQYPAPVMASQEAEEQWQRRQGEPMMQQLGQTLMQYVGIVRTEEGLQTGIRHIEQAMKEMETDKERYFIARETYFRHRVGWLIAKSALARTECRGGHYRDDFCHTLPANEAYHTLIQQANIMHHNI